jgi:hypothetical protein
MKAWPSIRQTRPASILGLALEEEQVAAVVLRRSGEALRVETSLTTSPGAELIDQDPERAGHLLSEALAKAGIREKRCAVRMPPSWALTSSVEIPEISVADLRSFFELRAEREFPLPPSELVLAHSRYQRTPGKGRATLAAIPKKRLASISAMLQAAGQRPVSLSLGLSACTARNGSPSAGAINLWPNGKSLDVIVSAGGGVFALRSLRAGGSGPADEAPLDPDQLSREIRLTLGRLPEDLRAQVREARFFGTSESAGSLMARNEASLRSLGMDSVKLYTDLAGPVDASGLPAPCLPALEVATRFLEKSPAHFEFLPPKVSRVQQLVQRYATGKRQVILGSAIGLAALVAVAAFAHSRYLASLESEWQAMATPVTELEAVQAKIRQFRPWFDNSARTLTLTRELTAAFPEEGSVWLKSLQIKPDATVTCTGSARSNQALLDVQDRLRGHPRVENLKVQFRGASPIQFTLQFAWLDGPKN